MTIVITDACCLINLCAAGDLLSLLPALVCEIYVSTKVLAETYYTLKWDEEGKLTQERIDLAPAINAGFLRTCDVVEGEETDLFVRLSTDLDDGEAACLAVAKVRGWSIATDDRKAIRWAGRLGVPTITTPELLKQWADETRASDVEIASVLRNIQTFARFVPRRGSPLYLWWNDQIDDTAC